ncbi:50S ribosomal protein L25 [Maledivibacter halophilus]|uniref:Large ribosomal subunit protein bL25 n=1 Tax=Maledivibacter halophilus TaxID=36842 RepID=A0A1T5MUQ9_9FIRM|nr:50S ribosomal protein L25 [Maledivibacter halophilus]SKC91956.1 large subunit ribosomal protein L25 [Maledivibacter halophilus]
MKSFINSQIRNDIGSNKSNRVRNNGHIPGVVYGHDIEPKAIEVDRRDLNRIIKDYGENILVDLEVGGHTITSMIKEIQRDPIHREVIHVDFQSISYDKPIQATVPILLINKSEAESNYATIQHQLREVNIECLPQDLPENIEISVKDLTFGNPIKVADIEFAQEITVHNEANEVIASLTRAGNLDDEEVEQELVTKNDFEPIKED